MATWEGIGDIENDIGAQIFGDGPVQLTPGTYTWTGAYAEAAKPQNTYASRMSIAAASAPQFNRTFLGLHGSVAPGGDTEEYSGTFTIEADGRITATGDVNVSIASSGSIDMDGAVTVPLVMIGSTAGPHGAGNHKTTGMSFTIDGGAVAPDPPPDPGDQQDVVDDDDVFIDTLVNISDKVIRIERTGWGSGSFRIRRDAVDAPLIGNGHDGRMVKVTIPRIDPGPIFRYMIETIETVVADENEQGEELISVGGRGALAYVGRAVASPFTYVIPSGPVEVHRGPAATGQKAGQILRRTIAEFQHVDRPQHPIPLITVDFDYSTDSDGNTWDTTDATEELAIGYTGDSGLSLFQELWGTGGIDMMLKPDGSMLLQGFNYYGRDLTGTAFGTGVVRFVKGVNIADRLTRTRGTELPKTYIWVEGDDLTFIDPPVSLADAGSRPVVESFMKTIGTDPTFLEAVGQAALIEALRRGESVAFNVAIPYTNDLLDEDTGMYLPGPPGTNGNFWIGDTVTVSSGTGVDDFENEDARIEAITIWFDPGNNLKCKVELKATTILGRLPPSAGSAGSFGGNPSVGGAGGTTIPPPPTSSDLHDHLTDTTDAHDASAVSFSPTGTIASTDVQAAIAEASGDTTAHLADTSDAHDASAISVLDSGNHFTATDVEAALAELATAGSGIPASIVDAKGDLIVGTANDTVARKAVGADDRILMADSAQSDGLKWVPPATPVTQAFGDAAAEGTSDDFARGGHRHGMPADPVTAHVAAGDPHTQYVERADDRSVAIVVDGAGSVPSTGVKASFKMPYAGHWRGAEVHSLANVTGSAVFDVWVAAYGSTPPVAANTITASAKPTLSSAKMSQDNTLTGWTTAFAAGDIVVVNLDSITTLTLVELTLLFDYS